MGADPKMPDSMWSSDSEADQRREWFQRAILPLEPRLRAYVRRLCRGRSDAEDLAHDTLLRAITTQSWREVANPWAFVRSIAKNLMVDHLRRQRIVTMELIGEFDTNVFADDTPGPEASVLARDELRRLAEAIAELPPQQRRVFTMRRLQGLSVHTIADRLNLSVSTVEKHLVRAVRACAEKLSGMDEDQ
jgi:RNA polymerase sigma-70 factor (ECF subfamily)